MDRIVLFGIGAYLLFKLFAKNPLKVGQPTVEWGDASLDGISLTLRVPVQNTGRVPVTIHSAQGQILYGDNYLGDITIDRVVTLQPGDDKSLQSSLFIQYVNLSQNIVQVISTKQFRQPVWFVGSIYVSTNENSKRIKMPLRVRLN